MSLSGCVVGLGAGMGFSAPAPGAQRSILGELAPTDVWLLGEQHDAPAHQTRQREVFDGLQNGGHLAALVIEMAERGGSTQGLPPDASEARAQEALRWPASQAAGWGWAVYGPLVMQAVRAEVPVLGGNLHRAEVRAAMHDRSLDQRLDQAAWQALQSQIREGHCQLLPEAQVVPMTRVQVARDLSMAQTIDTVVASGKTVLLVAGNQHARRDLGVPRHLRTGLRSTVVLMTSIGSEGAAREGSTADRVWPTEALPARDHCADFKAQMQKR
jgi:uncharacterized iron-regulated protein